MIKRFSLRYKTDNDTGFGSQSNNQGSRLINADGSYNVKHSGLPFLQRLNVFHELITLPTWKFNLLVFAAFIVLNCFFASLYLLVGMEQIEGDMGKTTLEQFSDAFFFSAQTLTTVGYGRQNPVGLYANLISAFECLVGLMSFALMTGLLYSRFSRPVAKLIFSEMLLIAPYQSKTGLMFRLANARKNHLIECEVELLLTLNVQEDSQVMRKFYNLNLERSRINSLALSWTIVHPIDEQSPLHEVTVKDLIDGDAEFMFFFKAFDDTYSQHVHTRYSYKASQIIENAEFISMFNRSEDGTATVLRLNEISTFEKINTLNIKE